MADLWRWSDLCAALNLTVRKGPAVTGIAIDSRTVAPGDLFVALPGDPGSRFNVSHRSNRDGHDYIEQAIAAGAVGALVSRTPAVDVPVLQVPDTIDGLWMLGAAARARMQGTVFAITGSSGKTTAKTWLAASLDAYASEGSLNNHLGVPLSLARMPAATTTAVFEIGTNHPGEIEPLARLVRPHIACVLNVHEAHIGNFDSLESLEKEKLSIYKGLTGLSRLILNEELPAPDAGVELVRYGETEGSDVRLIALNDGDTARITAGGETVDCHVPGGGLHRARTLTAVAACLHASGRSLALAEGLSESLVPAGRGRVHRVAGLRVVDDSYNANPESMRHALATLATGPGPRVAIIGDMLELGARTAAAHTDLADVCSTLDGVIAVGVHIDRLYARLKPDQQWGCYPDVDGVDLATVVGRLPAAATVLVKGSNGIFWQAGFVVRLLAELQAVEN